MIPYFLLIIIPAFFCFFAVKKTGKKRTLCIGSDDFIKENNYAIAVFFVLFLLLLILRDETVGRDLLSYKGYFQSYFYRPLNSIDFSQVESLFKALYWLIGRVSHDFQFYLAVIAVLTVIPIATLYNEEKSHSYLKIVLFLNMTTFVMIISGIRQGLALGLGMIAYRFVRKKNWIAFLLVVLLALGIHHSAFMILFMYPLYHISFKKKHLLFIVPAVGFSFIFNRQIFVFANNLLAEFSDEYVTQINATGAVTTLLLFLAFAVFSFVIPDETKMDKETLALRNFMVFSVFMQCFSPLHTLAMRLNYYFILFIPLLLPKILKIPSPAFRQVAKLGEIVLSVFFTLYFLYTIYIGCTVGNDALLDTCPYVPFWN